MSTNKDQIRGRFAEAKGEIQQEAGDLVDNDKLKARRKARKTRGKAQAMYGDAKQHARDTKQLE